MADQTSGDLEQALEYFKRFGAEARGLGDALNYAERAAEDLKEEFTSGTRDVGALKSSLQSSARAVKDAEKKYAKAQEEYNNTTDASRKEELRQSLAATRQRREDLVALHTTLDREVTARIDSIEAQKVFADSAIAAAKSLKTTIGGVLGGLQGNASAVGVAGSALAGAFSVAGSAGSALGSGMSAAGAAMTSSANKYTRGVGIALDGLGIVTGLLSKTISETAQVAIPYLVKEVERTLATFQTMSTSGALFADGMSGMRRAAADSGLSLETFSKIVSSNSTTFAATGMSVAGAAARFAKINTIIGSGPGSLQQQMLNLGYSLEEIGGLTAEVMSDLNRGGSLRYASDSQIAQLTTQYSKDLRLLSSITGEDARKKLEEGRKLTTQLAVRSKLMELEKQQPGITAEFSKIMGQLPAEVQQSIMEQMTTGTVFNAAGAQMMAQSSAMRDLVLGMSSAMTSGMASTEGFAQILGKAGDSLRAETGSGKFMSLGIAGLAGGAQQLNQALSGSVGFLDKFSADGVAKGIEALNGQANTTDDLTKKVTAVVSEIEKMRVKMETIVMESGALDKFAGALNLVTDAMSAVLKKLDIEVKKGGESTFSRVLSKGAERAAQGGGIGATVGTIGGGIAGGLGGTVFGGGVGGIPGAVAGAETGGVLGLGIGTAIGAIVGAIEGLVGDGKALGGVSAGPNSGYLEKLHGVEAVVPLPDGRSIPVAMDSSGFDDLAKLLREQIKLAHDMVDTLRGSQDIQDRLLANSY